MQTQVMFYVLPDRQKASDNENVTITKQSTEEVDTHSVLYHACVQASHFYRQGQRIFIYCQDKQGAEAIDEALWAFDTESFVPHNLSGEGPKQGSAVEISYQAPHSRRSVLINLTDTSPNFANQFNFVVDFVPTDATLKQQARERFKTYRQWGFQVDTQVIEPTQQDV